MPYSLGSSSVAKLLTVDMRLRVIVYGAIYKLPWPIQVIYGFRTEAAQEAAFAAGKTKLHWPHSKHNRIPLSLAVDIAPKDAETGEIDWKDLTKFDLLHTTMMETAKEHGTLIRWGMDWDMDGVAREKGTWEVDGPHFELVLPGEIIAGKKIV